MQATRQHDATGIDRIIPSDPVDRVVGIARTGWNPIDLADTAQLIAVARYERGNMAALCLIEPRHHLFQRKVAEPDDRDTDAVPAARTRRRFGKGHTLWHRLAFNLDAARLRKIGGTSHDRK